MLGAKSQPAPPRVYPCWHRFPFCDISRHQMAEEDIKTYKFAFLAFEGPDYQADFRRLGGAIGALAD